MPPANGPPFPGPRRPPAVRLAWGRFAGCRLDVTCVPQLDEFHMLFFLMIDAAR